MTEVGRSPELPKPGWYFDTTRTARWRYWDGDAWTPWIADGPTAVQDLNGAPEAPPPVPMSHAMGRRPPNPLLGNTRQDTAAPGHPAPAPEVRLPPLHIAGQPGAPGKDAHPEVWFLVAVFGGLTAFLGAAIYNSSGGFSDGAESVSAGFFLGPLMVLVGLVVLVTGLLGLTSNLITQADNRRRRRR